MLFKKMMKNILLNPHPCTLSLFVREQWKYVYMSFLIAIKKNYQPPSLQNIPAFSNRAILKYIYFLKNLWKIFFSDPTPLAKYSRFLYQDLHNKTLEFVTFRHSLTNYISSSADFPQTINLLSHFTGDTFFLSLRSCKKGGFLVAFFQNCQKIYDFATRQHNLTGS